ncbi:hypothetical protein KC317_g13302, partial [Hortaea werneckii]
MTAAIATVGQRHAGTGSSDDATLLWLAALKIEGRVGDNSTHAECCGGQLAAGFVSFMDKSHRTANIMRKCNDGPNHARAKAQELHQRRQQEQQVFYQQASTPRLYTKLKALAYGGHVEECRKLVEWLVRERREKPNSQLYSALILSNVSEDDGAAWRVMDYLEEMRQADIQIDPGICHSALKVLSVHPDHLLRADILEFMRARWFQLSEDGAHDVVAGLLRSGLFEQALERIEGMRQNSVPVHGWLLDMAVYMLCNIGEVDEAYHIMHVRHDSGEANLSRTLWHTLLDTGSSYRHHASTSLVWSTQVGPGYINPSSGICLNVLTTASKAGDAVLATDVFSHLSKR